MELLRHDGKGAPARIPLSRTTSSLIAAALLAGCAGGRGTEPAQLALTPEQQAWEQKIVATPMLVSSEYFRQRAQPEATIDVEAARRSQQAAESKQRALEERVARLEAGAAAPAASVPPGYVVKVSGGRIYTDLTAQQPDVRVGATLSILSERELFHPVTGRSLGQALEEIGEAKVVEAAGAFSVAEIVALRAGETVKPKDRVRVRASGGDGR